MDSITQAVLGAAVGEAVLGKKIGNKAAILGEAIQCRIGHNDSRISNHRNDLWPLCPKGQKSIGKYGLTILSGSTSLLLLLRLSCWPLILKRKKERLMEAMSTVLTTPALKGSSFICSLLLY